MAIPQFDEQRRTLSRGEHTVERESERGTALGCGPRGGADTFQLAQRGAYCFPSGYIVIAGKVPCYVF